jgi:hypothetical protein
LSTRLKKLLGHNFLFAKKVGLLRGLELGGFVFALTVHGAATAEAAATLAPAAALSFALAFSFSFAISVWRAGWAGWTLLGVGGREDLLREVELLTEVSETILSGGILSRRLGDEVVVPLPVEDFLQVAAGLERTADHVDLEVPDVLELVMALLGRVLLNNHDTLFEEVREDITPFFSGDHHHLEEDLITEVSKTVSS